MRIDSKDVSNFISKKLHNFNAGEELAWAWNSNENIIMFGPGGYGKSDAAILFHEYLHQKNAVQNSKPFIMSFGQGMTEEKLLGGIDMKTFQDSGEINYLLQNAFVQHEVVIFEELWDAFPAVLLILKDILQSKCVRMGNQVMPIKTKMVIACTNRSREEVVEDASTEALMQRFLFEKEVAWSSHTPGDYRKALYTATSEGDVFDPRTAEQVANICAASNTNQYTVSPRTCGKAYKSALINGIDSLRGMHGLSKGLKNFDELQREIAHQRATVKFFEEKVVLINSLKKQMELKQSFRHCAPLFKEIYRAYDNLSDYAVTDELVERKDECIKNCEKLFIIITQYMDSFIVNPRDESIPQRFMKLMHGKRWSRAANIIR
jgi:hypothetical protein